MATTSLPRTVLLIGMMGCGKTSVGRYLSQHFNVPFVDGDAEIEKAAGCSVSDIFRIYGEAEFREGERRVMTRLLNGPVCVLASGGGAWMTDETRELARDKAISMWIKADVDVLVNRTVGRKHRPLLMVDDPRQIIEEMVEERYPIYAEADLTIDSHDESSALTGRRAVAAIEEWIAGKNLAP